MVSALASGSGPAPPFPVPPPSTQVLSYAQLAAAYQAVPPHPSSLRPRQPRRAQPLPSSSHTFYVTPPPTPAHAPPAPLPSQHVQTPTPAQLTAARDALPPYPSMASQQHTFRINFPPAAAPATAPTPAPAPAPFPFPAPAPVRAPALGPALGGSTSVFALAAAAPSPPPPPPREIPAVSFLFFPFLNALLNYYAASIDRSCHFCSCSCSFSFPSSIGDSRKFLFFSFLFFKCLIKLSYSLFC